MDFNKEERANGQRKSILHGFGAIEDNFFLENIDYG